VQLKVLHLHGNDLEGPALPPSWLEPGAMQRLEDLDVGRNPRLNGTLPSTLPWPKMQLL